MINLEVTEAELKIIYNCVNGRYKYINKNFNNDKVQDPEKTKEYLELAKSLRDKLRPIKTAIWRKEQGKE